LSAITSSLTAFGDPVIEGSVKMITPSGVVMYGGESANKTLKKVGNKKPSSNSLTFIYSNTDVNECRKTIVAPVSVGGSIVSDWGINC
jgi:hypothetical protein